ncbi:tetratricopeptide repeat protein [Streptomyces sp. GMY02]|nr:tetratricopeptide repeat protein [Streptomyces sp. GMY02]
MEAWAGGRAVADLGHIRQRCVLAALLVDANRAVPADQLVDRVWADRSPQRALATLYSYLSRLRRAVEPAGDEVRIDRRPGGYVLSVDVASVDLHRFRQLVAGARTRDADDEGAAVLLEQALGLWRGEAFATVDTPWFNALRDTLHQERNAAELDLGDIQLRQGRHARLLAGLAARAEKRPLDERLAGQLMLALHRSGRPSDALTHYRRTRNRLRDDLGTDPSAELRRLHQRILDADPALAAPAARPAAISVPARAPVSVPKQLPAPPPLFTGRDRELALLDGLLDSRSGSAGTVVISAIGGPGGIGKTWLALRWAHNHLAHFPDGQLYADLRGFDPSGEPVPPVTALRGFLDALGADPAGIPVDPDAQAGLYRSLTSGRRLLIVLDNARDAAQVLPLLPGSPTCLVLVTSRHQLTGLVATHGARPLAVETLDGTGARRLLTRHLGEHRTAAEPGAVATILEHCAGLPLAIGIVAARAAAQPGFPLATLAEELQEAGTRLDALEAGDLTADLRAVFASSCDALDPDTARMFRLLGLAPGPDIGLPAAASLAALPVPRARALLRRLQAAHLVREHTPGRYRLHDLTRAYAAERARYDLPQDARDAALHRLVDFCLHTAHRADRLLFPHRRPTELEPPAAGSAPVPLEKTDALEWFDTERFGLLAAGELALVQGRNRQAWQLAWLLDLYHRHRGHTRDGLTAWRTGLTAAERLGDPAAEATAHWLLGRTRSDTGEYAPALDHLDRARALFRESGDRAGEAHAHRTLARIRTLQGDYEQALVHAGHALRLYQGLDNSVWEGNALNAVGWNHAKLGRYGPARSYCEQALALFRKDSYRAGEASALDSLGHIARHTGRYTEALDHYRQALRLCRETGNTAQVADALFSLGLIHQALGRYGDARACWQEALGDYRAQHRTALARRAQEHLDGLEAEASRHTDTDHNADGGRDTGSARDTDAAG